MDSFHPICCISVTNGQLLLTVCNVVIFRALLYAVTDSDYGKTFKMKRVSLTSLQYSHYMKQNNFKIILGDKLKFFKIISVHARMCHRGENKAMMCSFIVCFQ